MNLKYIGSFDEDLGGLVSFWAAPTRHDFELSWKDEEEKLLEIFEREFKLNCRNQLI